MNIFSAINLVAVLLVFLSPLAYAQSDDEDRPSGPVIPQSEFLLRSGVAYDASENILGLVRIEEPKSFFKPDTDQVTWWGEFKPFKTWGRPELVAKWHDPEGQLMNTQQFKGTVCRLAKATLQTANLNLEQSQGRWRVDIYMKGKQIDSKNFYVFSPESKLPSGKQPAVTVEIPRDQ